jgi:type I restriction enzyme R subunit
VLSDEAHRTQAGKFARNMRMALPNASFIGFTGTPLLKHDELTRRIFGNYVSRYDFGRSVQDGATVRLVYQNRGEQLGITHKALNADIYDAIEQADLDQDQTRLLERLLGKHYEVLTADDRLDKLADDFVPLCVERFETGKSMLVCVDKITCGRMYDRIRPRWQQHQEQLRAELAHQENALAMTDDADTQDALHRSMGRLQRQIAWMEQTVIEIIISEAQNEVRDFKAWGVDIVPHRQRMKQGFELDNGKTLAVDDAFKDPEHPFRVAIVCAMWLTGFDVECLATLYLDKPMKAHTLMQGVARANRVHPGKDCGVIVDYYGMLRSLKQAMADYAAADEDEEDSGGGDSDGGTGPADPLGPIEERVAALLEAIEFAEAHLLQLGFDAQSFLGAKGFDRIQGLKDARDRLCQTDSARRRFEILARAVFNRFKALMGEPSAYAYAQRHDNLEAIYRKLGERVDKADVMALLKELHRIVNLSIETAQPGADEREAQSIDLSRIDFARLREELGRKVGRPYAAVRDIRDLLEERLQAMLEQNPQRMDYQQRYQEIIDDYNAAKEQLSAEETLARLLALNDALDAEQQRAARERLTEDELALFDLLGKDDLPKKDREALKNASRRLMAALQQALAQMPMWTENPTTQAALKTTILDELWQHLPRPGYSDDDYEPLTEEVYAFVWQRSVSGTPLNGAPAS